MSKTTLTHNKELSHIFRQMADCYSYLGPEQRFRAQAYENASRTLANMQEPVDVLDFKKLDMLKGVGESIAEKIIEYLHTGKIKTFEKLKKQVPYPLLELLDIEGIGPSTLRLIHDKLKVKTKDDLVQALEKGKTGTIKSLAEKKADSLRKALKLDSAKKRLPLKEAETIGTDLLNEIKKIAGIHQCMLAGSLRRKKETIGDIDIVITAEHKNWKKIADKIISLPQIKKVLAAGTTRLSLVLKKKNVQVDIRIVHDDEFGAALFYLTGSKEHNIRLRTIAKKRGWKINEYGVFNEKTGKRMAGATEKEIYALFGLPLIPPEQRTGKDELSGIE